MCMQEACEARLLDRPLDFRRHGVYSGTVAPSEKSEEMASSKGMDFYALWATSRNQQAVCSKQYNRKVRPDVHDVLTYEIYYNEQWLHPALTHLRPDPKASATAA
jgi:hypothetical protein